MRAGEYALQGSLDNSGRILTGEIRVGTKRFGFQVKLTGAGKEEAVKAAKILESTQTQDGRDWKTVSIETLLKNLRDRFKFELPSQ